MAEQVTRHRGGYRDDDGKFVAGSDATLYAWSVAPGGSARYTERAREGLSVSFTVYFTRPVDLTNDDELTVRGERYQIIVNEWRKGQVDGREVLCTRGQG